MKAAIRRWHWWIAGGLLAVMFGLGLYSMMGNSAIVDEVAHIPSGYSYLHYGDYRLNPEHPPLIKDLAGLPLQFMNLKFPDYEPAWTTDVNGQWESGWNFLYHIGNDADSIIFWARFPILVLAILFGAWLYWYVRRHWGTAVGLLALGFYAFSPNILAHSILVTTDLGATVFIFMALAVFVWSAAKPSPQRLVVFSLALAAAQLAKFSAFLLYPYLLVITVFMVLVLRRPDSWLRRAWVYIGGLVGSSALSMVWVWLFYAPQTINMPQGVQDALIKGSIANSTMAWFIPFGTWLNDWAIFKPIVQYLLGVAMVFGRVAGGNVTYFNGQVSNHSYKLYFPEVFLLKTQVAFLLLLALVVGVTLVRVFHVPVRQWFGGLLGHMRAHVLEWTTVGFSVFYFAISVMGNLNLGVRHILPIYIPLFVVVAVGVVRWLRRVKPAGRMASQVVVGLLVVWYGVSTLLAAPYFLPYFNELIGGSANSNKYFSDSSVDWGQDLKRLKTYVADHSEIKKIGVDYFGGAAPEYYFCNRKYDANGQLIATAAGYDCTGSVYEPWHAQQGVYRGQYIAVSETFLENDRWYSENLHQPGYGWLRDHYTPVAKIGYSIFVYKLY
ncbi:MAG TPA: glycosyltransferase family 39 protein [Candidatus Saccharimonadia bacterium]